MGGKKKNSYLQESVAAPALLLDGSVRTTKRLASGVTAYKPVKKSRKYWNKLGPGLVTEASGQDPSGIATFSQTGAQYGFQFLWMAAWLFPLDSIVTTMCAKIGLVTGKGLAANIRAHFSKKVLYFCAILLFSANAINIGADLGAMAKAVQLLHGGLNFGLLVVAFAAFSLGFQLYTPYAKYAKYLKWLALALISYIISAILAHLDWQTIAHHALVPHITLTKESLIIICAIMGTTVSPYLFFWQASQTVEEEIQQGKKTLKQRANTNKRAVKWATIDVWSGAFLAEIVMFFIIAACGGVLYSHGVTNIETAAQAAEALRPFAGNATYFLFALGIIGSGLLAIPVLAGSSSYVVSESLGWKEGMSHKVKGAAAFYGTIIISVLIGMTMNFLGIDPIKALIYAAVVNGIVSPIILVLIMIISSDEKIMGRWANRKPALFFGWTLTAAMMVGGCAAIYALVTGA